MQQQNDLEKAHNRPLIDPRKAILKDMEKYTRDLIQRGHEVIIVGDTNEHLQKEGNKIDTMLDNLTMINIMQQQHPTTDLPSTYDRGPNCLDMAASTQHVSQHVQAAGFLALLAAGAAFFLGAGLATLPPAAFLGAAAFFGAAAAFLAGAAAAFLATALAAGTFAP